MDRILFWLVCASVVLLLLAVGVAWWEHRRHLARVKQRQALAEHSRFALEAHAQAVDAKLLSMSAALQHAAAPMAAVQTKNKDSKGSNGGKGSVAPKPGRDDAVRPSLIESAVARTQPKPPERGSAPPAAAKAALSALSARTALSALAAAVPAMLASRAELAAMEKQPNWEETQPMVLETRSFEFAPTQLENHAFDFEPTQPVDLSPH